MLLADETHVGAMVVGQVREIFVKVSEVHTAPHRLVMVHIDGEETPRRVEYTRLREFSEEGTDGTS